MFSRNRLSAQTRSYAVFDIGASSIGAGLLVCGPKGVELLWHNRIDFAFVRHEEYARYEKSMYAALLEVSMGLVTEGVRVAGNHSLFSMRGLTVTGVLGAPWFLGTVLSRTHTNEGKYFPVTQAIMDGVHASMLSAYLDSADCKSWVDVMGTAELLELHNIQVLLDEYPVTLFDRRSTRALTVQTYLAIVAQSVTEHVRDIIHRTLPNHPLTLTSATRCFADGVAMRTADTLTHQVSVVEIGGQMTSVSLFRHGALAGTRTVPYGTNDFLSAIAPPSATLQQARSAYQMLGKNTPSFSHTVADVPDALKEVGTRWASATGEALVALSQGIITPTKALLIVDELYELTALLLTQQVSVKSRTHNPPPLEPEPYPLIRDIPGSTVSIGVRARDDRLVYFAQSVDDAVLHQSH